MKKKRSSSGKMSKSRDRSPQSGDEIISARDRFKGALHDLLPHSEEDSEPSDDDLWASKSKRLALSRKRGSGLLGDKQSAENDSNKYVMKLYDRSVDLAQFSENTPLYPICRAWIINQPNLIYSVKKEVIKEEPREEDEEETIRLPECGEDIEAVTDTFRLPRPLPSHSASSLRIPQPLIYNTAFPRIPQDLEDAPSRDEILTDNLQHWKRVKRSWLEAAEKNDSRYEKSIRLLTAIYNKNA